MAKTLGQLHKSRAEAEAELKVLLAEAKGLNQKALRVADAERTLQHRQLSDPTFGLYQALGHDAGEEEILDAANRVEDQLTRFWKSVDLFLRTTFDDGHAEELGKSLYPPPLLPVHLRTQHLVNELKGLDLQLPHYSDVPPLSQACDSALADPVQIVFRVFDHLRAASKPLCKLRKDKLRLALDDEYDVQDILEALLTPWFDDIRREEWTPSRASTSKRMDFLLKKERIAIETKYVSDAMRTKRIPDEIDIDTVYYMQHKDVDTLLALVFDPNGLITKPAAMESDLSGLRSVGEKKLMGYLRIRPLL